MGDIDSVNHVGLVVHDLRAAVAFYERLGFIFSPLSMHKGSMTPGEPEIPYGSGNRCAIFGHNYLEIVAHVDKERFDFGIKGFLSRFEGAHIICFGCGDAHVVNRRVTVEGITTSGVIPLQRNLGTPDGERTARFDCVHFPRSATPEGLIQAAHHRTPEYIHQARYLGHPNRVIALSNVFLCVDDPDRHAALYTKLIGRPPVRDGASWVFRLPVACAVTIVGAGELQTVLPGAAPPALPCIAGYEFSTEDLELVRRRMTSEHIPFEECARGLMVPAGVAFGASIIFGAA